MNKEELKEKLFKLYTYQDDEQGLVYDYCENCERPIVQEELQGEWYCEYCKSSSQINIIEVEE